MIIEDVAQGWPTIATEEGLSLALESLAHAGVVSEHLSRPFNIAIFRPEGNMLRNMRQVTSSDIHENTKGDLHPDGLFSVEIFGRAGSAERDKRFAYIDIKTEIFHPLIYQVISRVRRLYAGIINGELYATWDEAKKDFVPANELDGETGFSFFCRHWRDIEFSRNRSFVRDARIDLLEKFKDVALTSKILVMPAGMRDLDYDENGRPSFHEINNLYMKLISTSRLIGMHDEVSNDPAHDLQRRLLQSYFNDIFNNIESMIGGKEGFFLKKWSSRTVVNSTRNVITALDSSAPVLGAPNTVRFTDTMVGIWQLSRGLLPLTIHLLRNGFISKVFDGSNTARLVDPKTLRSSYVSLSADARDRWTTVEGLEKVVFGYKAFRLRNRPLMVDGHYLGLIYAPPENKVFKLFHDIDELPQGANRKHVRPINLMELIYLSGYKVWNDQVGTVTRYPIAGTGSCYPTTVYVKTTVEGEVRRELDDLWQPMDGNENLAIEFPTYSPLAYYDTLGIASARLAGLSADFDGDTGSFIPLYTDARKDFKAYLASKMAYVDPIGGLRTSGEVLTTELFLRSFTGPVKVS